MKVGIVFPHQLFEVNDEMLQCDSIFLVEEWLYFKQYNFHQQKTCLHRATMKFYENYLHQQNIQVRYIEAIDELSDIRKLIPSMKSAGIDTFDYIDTTDHWLEQRIENVCRQAHVKANKIKSKLFISDIDDFTHFFAGKKRMFQTDFYKYQRIKNKILVDSQQQPIGGKWSFDAENRLKYPKGAIPPKVNFLPPNQFYKEAKAYTQQYFSTNYGVLNGDFIYPTTFEESKKWLHGFFETRFFSFGEFEDAIVKDENVLHHSILTPMLNIGLLTPQYIVEQTLEYIQQHDIPFNSVEGFIRQIIGWREFIRAVYVLKGTEERTKNYWGFTRKIPASFWNGTTGIVPIDVTIKKVLDTGYCHHIERLMVLGNFMLLCEFDPDEVYRWFMELFIDAYDWVMVPNVYGMSQFSDGGIMATKPYISGSNYLMKMSDYPKGDWQSVWDGLFWRFMSTHRNYFSQNPRLGMLVRTYDKMPETRQQAHLNAANQFLASL